MERKESNWFEVSYYSYKPGTPSSRTVQVRDDNGEYECIPNQILSGLVAWSEEGIGQSGSIMAILENRFQSVVCQWSLSGKQFTAIAKFLYNRMPMESWGSKERVDQWGDHGGLNGLGEWKEIY